MKKRILSCLMALALCLTLLPATAQAADNTHTHCLCGAAHNSDIKTHQEGQKTPFEKWLSSALGTDGSSRELRVEDSSSPTYGATVGGDSGVDGWLLPAGTYYLKGEDSGKDVTIDRPIVIRSKVTICLNGMTLQSKYKGTKPVFLIESKGELTLTDCQNGGKVMHYDSDSRGSGVQVNSGGTFNLYGGTIFKNMADYGGGVLVGGGGTFNMYGGSITDNKADGDLGYGGGGVCERRQVRNARRHHRRQPGD